jgi:glycosyltransferase involved in cell wall biosynthesis
MKVFYWSPFFSNVATISAVLNSAKSLIKFKKNYKYDVSIINAIGEWNDYKKISPKEIIFKDLTKKNWCQIIPKNGFLKSRFSYLFIFIVNIRRLLKLINSEKPDYLIIHLITSLPIFLSPFFNKKTKIILRLSGLPNLNIVRSLFWRMYSKRIHRVTCPTQSTFENILNSKIFDKNKVCVLKDPIINIKEIQKKSCEKLHGEIVNQKYILSIGRLTKQKNFKLLLNFFNKLHKIYPEYKLYILGDGEDKTTLINMIDRYGLKSKAIILGHKNNVFKYLKYADCFILTSLWEDPGFVLAEAGIMNTNIISSDCPNGPKEIICDKDFLFLNGSSDSLFQKFNIYKSKTDIELFNQKIKIKKRTKFYTSFRHFKKLNLILNESN